MQKSLIIKKATFNNTLQRTAQCPIRPSIKNANITRISMIKFKKNTLTFVKFL